MNDIILDSYGDEHGDLIRIGRKGSRYFVEYITPAFEPNAGKKTRKYKRTRKEAEDVYDEFVNTDEDIKDYNENMHPKFNKERGVK